MKSGVVIIMGIFYFSVNSWMCDKNIYTGISIFVHLGLHLGVCMFWHIQVVP